MTISRLAGLPLTRPSATLSPSDGERDGVRGDWSIPPLLFGNWFKWARGGPADWTSGPWHGSARLTDNSVEKMHGKRRFRSNSGPAKAVNTVQGLRGGTVVLSKSPRE